MYNNKIYMYREKKYPHDGFVMSIIQKSWLTFFIKPETQQPIIVIIFDYLLSLPFKEPCRTLGIYFR